MESLLPLRLDVVTVLLLAVRAVKVLTSHKKMALSRPAEATLNKKRPIKTNYTGEKVLGWVLFIFTGIV
jgi:hypothetical protein